MHVRMLGIEVHGGYPFQTRLQIFLHTLNEFSRVFLEVQAIAELRGHNDFEEALIARPLPTVEDRGDIYVRSGGVKSCTREIATVRSAVARDIASMCLPLTLVFVFCVRHSDGHPLGTESGGTKLPDRLRLGLAVATARAVCHLSESKHRSDDSAIPPRIVVRISLCPTRPEADGWSLIAVCHELVLLPAWLCFELRPLGQQGEESLRI